jgi:nucleoside-diphosphate-sugar epimerase
MKVFITGAGGFLGSALARILRARGDEVTGYARGHYPHLERLGVHMIRGDVTAEDALAAAMTGHDIVVHAAAKAGVWGDAREYWRTNVAGTQAVLNACRKAGVRRLVFTSSPSVVFTGRDQHNLDESAPYPAHYEAAYPASKAAAEKLVLLANSPELATVALRPHLIWGPGDPHIIPRLVARARAGRLRIVGSGKNLVDTTFIANAAHAHVLAIDRLAWAQPIAGRAYFIANGEPMPLWQLISEIVQAYGLPPPSRHISAWGASAVGGALELMYRLLRLTGEPPMTRFVARELAKSHWFNLQAARRDLEYEPRVSVADGLEQLRAALRKGP